MEKISLAVLFGSRSCEHDVSIVSAIQLMDAVNKDEYDVIPIYISREGIWYTGDALRKIETFRSFNPLAAGITRVLLDTTAKAGDLWAWPPKRQGLFAQVPKPLAHIDCAIPVFHGMYGEDGTVQGMLEMAGIPYASTGVLGSSVGMDKIAMKLLLRGAGFPVLDFVWFTRDEWPQEKEAILEKAEKQLKYPMFVKPASLGSSIGVTKAHNQEELIHGVELAQMYDFRILIEAGVDHPTEINCAAVGYGNDIRTSVCEMPISANDDHFLDFFTKYLRNAGAKGSGQRGMKTLSRVIPAPVGDVLTDRIQQMTREIFHLLDCKGTIRVDFMLDENEILYVNEPNTIPGSMAFYLWKAAGLSFPDLIDEMVRNAMQASGEKEKNVFAFDSNILNKVISGTKGSKH